MFAEFVLPYLLEIEAFHGGMDYIHSCGNQTPIQKYLLKIESLLGFEVSPWSDLDQSLINIPSDRWLTVALHPNEVLCTAPDQMRARLREINSKCAGRAYSIGTSGLTPITDDPQDYIEKIRNWTKIALEEMPRQECCRSA
jgi:hypothetical protein